LLTSERFNLPRAFRDTGDETLMAHFAEANAADAKAAHIAARASATIATIVHARLKLGLFLQALCLGNQTLSGHVVP
jgi:hypothetical protein